MDCRNRSNVGKMSETSSISSGSTVGSGNRVLQLASRGEWATLEQALKSIDKGDRDISHTDEVSNFSFLELLLVPSIAAGCSANEQPVIPQWCSGQSHICISVRLGGRVNF